MSKVEDIKDDLRELLDKIKTFEKEQLVEIQHPVRQFEVIGVDDLGAVREGAGIFVVGIEQQDVALRVLLDNGLKHQAGGAGLAAARRAQDRKVLAQQLVIDDVDRDLAVLVQRAHSRRLLARRRVDALQVGPVGGHDL